MLDLTYCFNVNMDPVTGNCGVAPIVNNGNVVQIKNSLNTARTQNFAYDELNRIASAQSAEWSQSFLYDIWANLKKITAAGSPGLDVGVDASNHIPGFCYDAAGNLKHQGACPGSTYVYDGENRLTSTAGVTYTYDGDGKRVQKSTGKLYWYGMLSDPLLETDGAGNNPTEFVFFNGRRIARRGATGTVYYFFADHLSSSRVVTNATGTVVEDSDYYPFGAERIVVDTLDNQYKFTGKERDAESGLDYFGARHYGSSISRFLQADAPLVDQHVNDPQSWNLYSYTRNNPLRYIDDDGRGAKEGVLNWVDRTGFAFLRVVLEPDQVAKEMYAAAKEVISNPEKVAFGTAMDIVTTQVTATDDDRVTMATEATLDLGLALLLSAPARAETAITELGIGSTAAKTTATAVVKEGVYEGADALAPGKTYVGQSGETFRRVSHNRRQLVELRRALK